MLLFSQNRVQSQKCNPCPRQEFLNNLNQLTTVHSRCTAEPRSSASLVNNWLDILARLLSKPVPYFSASSIMLDYLFHTSINSSRFIPGDLPESDSVTCLLHTYAQPEQSYYKIITCGIRLGAKQSSSMWHSSNECQHVCVLCSKGWDWGVSAIYACHCDN